VLRPSAQLHSALLNGEVPPSSSGASGITTVPGFRWSPRAKARGRSSCRWSTGDRERGGPGRPPPTPICKEWPPPAKGSAHRDSHELLDLTLRSVSEDVGSVPQGSPANKPHECLWHPIGCPRRFPPEATLVSSKTAGVEYMLLRTVAAREFVYSLLSPLLSTTAVVGVVRSLESRIARQI